METRLDEEGQRFFAFEDSKEIGHLFFEVKDNVLSITHTRAFVEGKGVGKALVVAAIDYAKEHGMKIRPICPFAYDVMLRNDEYRALMTNDAGEDLACKI